MLSEIHPIFQNIGAPPTSLPRKRLFQCSCSMTRLGLLKAKPRFDSLLNVIYGIVSSPNSYIEGLTIQLPSVTVIGDRAFKEMCSVAQSDPTLHPMDCVYSLPDASVHRILQARILEWVVITYSSFKDIISSNQVRVRP